MRFTRLIISEVYFEKHEIYRILFDGKKLQQIMDNLKLNFDQ